MPAKKAPVPESVPESKFKVPPRRVDCSDFEIEEDGHTYRPHDGEWVDILPVKSFARWLAYQKVRGEGDAESFDLLLAQMSRAIVAWNWTDWGGEPMPEPYKHPEVIAALDNREVQYLINAVQAPPAR